MDDRKRRKSFGDRNRRISLLMRTPDRVGSSSSLITTPITPVRQKVSEEEAKRSFEEWMKIAADNKINSNNCFNLALIDYFHDLTLLRDGDAINFQRASCTLDGCIKIYTSRVDYVDVETKKLLSGLADRMEGSQREPDEDGGDEDDEDDDGESPNPSQKPSKKKPSRGGKTLEKDFGSLNIKKLELDFMVDPLFKKTSADFDEGGAHGLLLNHLAISSEGGIIFDSSDLSSSLVDADSNFQNDRIDITKLKSKFEGSLNQIWGLSVCPSLKSFSFSFSGSSIEQFDIQNMINEAHEAALASASRAVSGGDAGTNGETPWTGYDSDDMGANEYFDDDDGAPYPNNDHEPLNESGIALFEESLVSLTAAPEEDLYSYFDTRISKSWAGPEFWKLRSLKNAAKPASRTVKQREVVTIDFQEDEPLAESELFAFSKASLSLPKQSEKAGSRFLLPEDVRFSSKDLLGLFLKPNCKAIFLKKKSRPSGLPHTASSVNPDPNEGAFWAEHDGDDVAFSIHPADSHGQDADPYDGFSPMNDHYDDDDDDDVEEIDLSVEDYAAMSQNGTYDFGSQLVNLPKKTKAVPLNFAKTAKKVDVKLLKENLWKTMSHSDDLGASPDQTSGEVKFTEVVSDLKQHYSDKKLKDISPAFCFICVLHLANEQGLEIQGNGGLSDLMIQGATLKPAIH
ncbi:condensin complex subunit 2/barren [Polychytrium aggregatum]|uniref:condensin complex subunit 2/barren n=1 Tax=Polychytrium aggregatum TaxID=110093 RepID=UPI0022FDEA0A|nr:condensin complex subunit 2/barren [Polychytrium aggregatum]KAI9206244.1 condensin complex subunit 2/barren [Polychytrium aggregatum]